MYFQLEVYFYSNEANKNKYKSVQLIAWAKNNVKVATAVLNKIAGGQRLLTIAIASVTVGKLCWMVTMTADT